MFDDFSKVRGMAELWAVNNTTGEKQLVGEYENDICWPLWRWIFSLDTTSISLPTKRDTSSAATSPLSDRWYLYYGSTDIKDTPLNAWYSPDASVYVDNNTPFWTAGATTSDPDIVTWTAVLSAPVGSPRTIRVLGLDMRVGSTRNDAASQVSATTKFTLLRLSTPCVQNTDTTLVITYRLFLPPTVSPTNTRQSPALYNELKAILKRSCDAVNSINFSYTSLNYSLSYTSYNLDNIPGVLAPTTPLLGTSASRHELCDSGDSDTANVNWTYYTNTGVKNLTYAATATPITGAFIQHAVVGGAGIGGINNGVIDRSLFYTPVDPAQSNPFQTIWIQRANPTGPLQDTLPANVGTMTGGLTLNAGSWVDPNVAKHTRIRITNTGAVGVATYQVDVMLLHGGFAGNTWNMRTRILPQNMRGSGGYHRTSVEEEVYEDYHNYGGMSYRSPDNDRLVAVGSCLRTKTGISIYDVISGRKYNFNALSTPALNVTAVSDLDCSNGFTYVGCANTGLYRINAALNTVEAIPAPPGVTNKVYQICAKNDASGTLWVLYDGGLCKLSNPGAALGSLSWTVHNPTTGSPTFTYVGITDGNWATVTAMIVNPDNDLDDEFLFVSTSLAGGSTTGSNRLGYVWWRTSTGVAANPTTSGINHSGLTWNETNLLRLSDCIRCVDGKWVAGNSHPAGTGNDLMAFTYGSNNLAATRFTRGATAYPRPVPATINGVKGILTSMTAISGVPLSSVFIRSSVLTTIPNATTVNAASVYKDFVVRHGSTTYNANIEDVTSIVIGMVARPFIYLPGSNVFFSWEVNNSLTDASFYGVTPFCLPPSHANYNAYKNAFWKTYGHDGSNWVLNHAGSKTTHAGAETLPDLDGLTVAFSDGGSGTSFVNGEWFSTAVGMGVFKENGTSLDLTISHDFAPCERLTISDNVPLTPLGALTDEPVTFTPFVPDFSGTNAPHRLYQNKGTVTCIGFITGNESLAISDQLIPASTDFDLRFKWISLRGAATTKAFGLATYAPSTYTYGVHFRFNTTTGNLEVYNNTTIVGSVITNPDPTKECRIARVGTTVSAYYDGTPVGSVTSSSQFSVMARSSNDAHESGWYDAKLTYTENRRVLRLGNSGSSTGSYSPKFSSLTSTSLAKDAKVLIGSGSPLEAILDYTTSAVALTATGRVKVAAGAGWLIFHDSEVANPVSGYATAHYVP